MPTLDWIGKKAVVNHHREVPFHLLHCDPSLSVGDPDSGNLLVQGDNPLKALDEYNYVQVHPRPSPDGNVRAASDAHR